MGMFVVIIAICIFYMNPKINKSHRIEMIDGIKKFTVEESDGDYQVKH